MAAQYSIQFNTKPSPTSGLPNYTPYYKTLETGSRGVGQQQFKSPEGIALRNIIAGQDPDNYKKLDVDISHLPSYGNGNQFLNYRQPATRNTSYFPSSSYTAIQSNLSKLPFDGEKNRMLLQKNAIGQGNMTNEQTVFATQTLGNVATGVYSCTSDADCLQFNTDTDNFTCNTNRFGWDDVYGNQPGPVCVRTVYPELQWVSNGQQTYNRKLAGQGGIGSQCNSDKDCSEGYSCKQEGNVMGGGEQVGFCAQRYICPEDPVNKVRYLQYGTGGGFPVQPNADQNNFGSGYSSYDECIESTNVNAGGALQVCVQKNGKWFATFPGYCPLPAANRDGNNPQGAFRSFSSNKEKDFVIPAGVSGAIEPNSSNVQALNSLSVAQDEETPLQYMMKRNALPKS